MRASGVLCVCACVRGCEHRVEDMEWTWSDVHVHDLSTQLYVTVTKIPKATPGAPHDPFLYPPCATDLSTVAAIVGDHVGDRRVADTALNHGDER